MSDLAYVLGTLAFFALMRGYVTMCARLGRDARDARDDGELRS